MLTFIRQREILPEQLYARRAMIAGLPCHLAGCYVPAGRYNEYQASTCKILAPVGQKEADYSGSYYYLKGGRNNER